VPSRAGTGVSAKRRDVHERTLRLLAVRQRSRAELERRLLGAGFGAEEVAAELHRLQQVGLVDDRAFAQAVVEHAIRARGEGRRAVRRRLVAAGVSTAIAEGVLDDVVADDEGDRALALARSRVSRLRDLPPDRAFSRLWGFLARRGYAPDVARWAARKALALEAVDG
jgi:regulatory protein